MYFTRNDTKKKKYHNVSINSILLVPKTIRRIPCVLQMLYSFLAVAGVFMCYCLPAYTMAGFLQTDGDNKWVRCPADDGDNTLVFGPMSHKLHSRYCNHEARFINMTWLSSTYQSKLLQRCTVIITSFNACCSYSYAFQELILKMCILFFILNCKSSKKFRILWHVLHNVR